MSIVTTLKDLAARPLRAAAGEWSRMAPRERRLASALGGAVVGLGVLLGGGFIVQSLGDLAQANADAREALDAIARHRDEYLEAKQRMVAQEVRLGSEAPQLATDLEAAARDAGIQIPESNERPAAPAGKRHVEHAVDIKLRQVDLPSLTKFLAKLETGRRLIVVSRMSVRRNFAQGDKLDVEMTATAYERVKEERGRRRGGAPATGTSAGARGRT